MCNAEYDETDQWKKVHLEKQNYMEFSGEIKSPLLPLKCISDRSKI